MPNSKMINWQYLFVIFLILISHSSYSKESYTTIGKVSCQTWGEDLVKSKDKEKIFAWVSSARNRAWLLGFANGVNYMLDDDLLSHLDADLIIDWTTKYCAENPDKDVLAAISSLLIKTRELTERNGSK